MAVLPARDLRETVAFEVVVRFYPGAEREAHEFYDDLRAPDECPWIRLDRIVVPDGEERLGEAVRQFGGGSPWLT
jgi:hypothetical protein